VALGVLGERRPQRRDRQVIDGEPVGGCVRGGGQQFADDPQVGCVGRGGVRAVLAGPAGEEERLDRLPQRQRCLVVVGVVGVVVVGGSRCGHRARLAAGPARVGEARREVMDNAT